MGLFDLVALTSTLFLVTIMTQVRFQVGNRLGVRTTSTDCHWTSDYR
ncbi:MAG TPA: hypothetical protein VFV38_41060 [Ktedonobacteraceae bacterium]|nr:hypothetical protein [Ktedonobacteraceae bacterium]